MPSSDLSRELREAAEDNQLSGASWHYGFTQADLRWTDLCSPANILSLLDKADAAEAKIKQLEERIGLEMWRRNQATIRELKVKADAAEGLAEALNHFLRQRPELRYALTDEQAEALARFRAQEATSLQPNESRCDYCGLLGWTVISYGRVTHKLACPYRTDPWNQTYPEAE